MGRNLRAEMALHCLDLKWKQRIKVKPARAGGHPGSATEPRINADQLLQNDREHMLRLQGVVELPWKIDASLAVNWQTGRPYARLARQRLGQGSTFFIVEKAARV